MDIGSRNGYPASKLSNFSPRRFVFDDVVCESAEGVLQSLKFDKFHIQAEVCKLIGLAAKRRGYGRNKAWRQVQMLWWKEVPYDRHGQAYQTILDQIYNAMLQNDGFKKALLASGYAVFTHSMGRSNPLETILTKREFCSQLTRLRAQLRV